MTKKQLCPACNQENDTNTHNCKHCHTNLTHASPVNNLSGQGTHLQPSTSPKPDNRNTSDDLFSGEFWFNKIGMALVLLALALLFKLAVDRGWVTPPIRVGLGITLATSLLSVGMWLNAQRPKLATVLMGGALVSYYLTGFAAYQMYALIPHPIALAFMICVTIGAFGLAMRQDDGMLAIIGTLGGLATPFLLPTDDSNVVGLMGYTCLLLTGTIALYVYRGWSIILWISFIGGWLIAALSILMQFAAPSFDKWAIQAGIVYMAVLFWIVPVVRTMLHSHNPNRWRETTLGLFDRNHLIANSIRYYDICLLTLITPFASLLLSTAIWPGMNEHGWGWVVLFVTGLFSVALWLLRNQPTHHLIKQTHAITAVLLLTLALVLLFNGTALFFALMLEALVLHWAAKRWSHQWLTIGGHGLALMVGLWFLPDIFEQITTPVILSETLMEFGIIGIFFLSIRWLKTIEERVAYFAVAHVAFLVWSLIELHTLTNGQALVSAIWGIYASVLFAWSVWYQNNPIRYTAVITFLGIVAKLLLIDFAHVDALWRIVLFFGFGVFFLFLSYVYPSLWRLSSKKPAKQGTP